MVNLSFKGQVTMLRGLIFGKEIIITMKVGTISLFPKRQTRTMFTDFIDFLELIGDLVASLK